jgi:competence protein ComEA
MSVEEEIRSLGFKVVFVPHHVIKNYNACYRVKFQNQLIFPPAADKLGIPLNEIWISKSWREFAAYILFHELQEIKHRAAGYDGERAHRMAVRNAEHKFRGDPKHERLRREINVVSKETLIRLLGVDEAVFQEIKRNRPYHSLDELREKIPNMDESVFKKIKEHFWCLS